MSDTVEAFEVGDKLRYIGIILLGEDDLPMDAIERQAEVTEVDDRVYIRYGDGVEDLLYPEQVMDMFERVTWDTEVY